MLSPQSVRAWSAAGERALDLLRLLVLLRVLGLDLRLRDMPAQSALHPPSIAPLHAGVDERVMKGRLVLVRRAGHRLGQQVVDTARDQLVGCPLGLAQFIEQHSLLFGCDQCLLGRSVLAVHDFACTDQHSGRRVAFHAHVN